MDNIVELTNLEIKEYCMLNRATGEIYFYEQKKIKGYTGLYFKDNKNFLGLYPTENGVRIYFKSKEYEINPELNITLIKDGKHRRFCIHDYGIEINYIESPYIDFDAWSDEIDVDLLFRIQQSYRNKEFYDRNTTLKSDLNMLGNDN
jgi:hypothetical protein